MLQCLNSSFNPIQAYTLFYITILNSSITAQILCWTIIGHKISFDCFLSIHSHAHLNIAVDELYQMSYWASRRSNLRRNHWKTFQTSAILKYSDHYFQTLKLYFQILWPFLFSVMFKIRHAVLVSTQCLFYAWIPFFWNLEYKKLLLF